MALPIPVFSGEYFGYWCVKMKTVLRARGLCQHVEEPPSTSSKDLATREQIQQLEVHKRSDAEALCFIQQGLSNEIFEKIVNARTAKEAWDTLQKEYGSNPGFQGAASGIALERLVDNPTNNQPAIAGPRERQRKIRQLQFRDGKPWFQLVLAKSHVNPACRVYLPARMGRILPSAVVPVFLQYAGNTWEMSLHGDWKRLKGLDGRWRNFVDDNVLVLGDIVEFELMENESNRVVFHVQIIRGSAGRSSNNPVLLD